MFLTDWKMTYAEHKALPCIAPCSMYSVLLQHGLMDDPYYGMNELKATPLSEQDCIFETEFMVDENILVSEGGNRNRVYKLKA